MAASTSLTMYRTCTVAMHDSVRASSDLEAEQSVGLAQRALDLGGQRGLGEDEAQVAARSGYGFDALAARDGDVHRGDARHGVGLLEAEHLAQHAGGRNRDHHHPRG